LSDKKSGVQKCYPGETLRWTKTPDTIIEHYPPARSVCGAALSAATAAGHVA
jgi:hypothetical protein